jgi:S1-C subfamily serine protease
MTTIGRSRQCNLRVDDESVSANHARLERRGDEFWILDLSSTNGTYLNGRRMGEALLSNGDRVRFGDVEFVFDGAELVIASRASSSNQPLRTMGQPTERRIVSNPIAVSAVFLAAVLAVSAWLVFARESQVSTLSLARATFLVVILDSNDEPCGSGSGFLVRDSQTVATNHHVIASVVEDLPNETDCKTVVVGISDDSGLRIERFEDARVIKFDKRNDVAILEVRGLDDLGIKPISLRTDEPRLSEEIQIFGYPGIGGVSLTFTDGFLAGIDESMSPALYKTTSQIAGGNSGGPVFDKDGRAIGLAAARFTDSEEVESIGLIIPIRYLAELLARG